MPGIDQFESVFRGADHAVFAYDPPRVARILAISDLDRGAHQSWREQVQGFLPGSLHAAAWSDAGPDDYGDVAQLLELERERRPDLVVTYRNLGSDAWRWPYSLGTHLDVLTRVGEAPVLVVPHPGAGRAAEHAQHDTDVVMAMTDHLAGDGSLVNWAASLATDRLLLTHVEDDRAFERFMAVIAKVPDLDTDLARREVAWRLRKDPADYAGRCRAVLAEHRADLRVDSILTEGHRERECRRLVEERRVDLLVLHTEDDHQLAMHGLAYQLAVAIRSIPVLLL